VSVTCDWSGEGANQHMATFVRVRVLESYRGAVHGEQTLEFFGGQIRGRSERVDGMPEFRPGDIEVLFVRENHRNLSPLVGFFHGRFRVLQNAANGETQIYLHDRTLLTDLSQVGREPAAPGAVQSTGAAGAPARGFTLDAFATKIRSGLLARGVTPDAK
jgi:hypothetical protein